jgi:hypothetical protein
MQIRNGDELDLAGNDGENITVKITQAVGAVNNFVLNGQSWPGGTFRLDKTVAPVFKLLVQTVYKSDSGNSCEITVTGSGGGDISVHDEIQAPGETFDAAVYTFIILK